jgi:hypothetical protein
MEIRDSKLLVIVFDLTSCYVQVVGVGETTPNMSTPNMSEILFNRCLW